MRPARPMSLVREDGAELAMLKAACGQPRALLPALDGSNFVLKVSRNLLPGVETIVGWPVLRLCAFASHGISPTEPVAPRAVSFARSQSAGPHCSLVIKCLPQRVFLIHSVISASGSYRHEAPIVESARFKSP
jgi:hypothetical protein